MANHLNGAWLFDLDGTLADTAEDLRLALNRLLAEENLPAVAADDIRELISRGSTAMLEVGLQFDHGSERHHELRQRLFDFYIHSGHEHTQLFPGMDVVLQTLETAGIPWGIVTNKLTHLAAPVIDKLGIEHRIACLVCADTTGKAKPDPEPLLHAAELIQQKPLDCIYIGDAHTDSLAASAAGMPFIAAAYGYLPAAVSFSDWQTKSIIHHPQELLAWLPEPGTNGY